MAQTFGLHELAVEDAVNAHQRPKLERYGETLFLVLRPARYVDETETVEFGEVRHLRRPALRDHRPPRRGARSRPRPARARGASGPARARTRGDRLRRSLDHVVDGYAPVVAGLENDIDEIEDEVFSGSATVSRRIYELTREVIEFQRATKPLAGILARLIDAARRRRRGAPLPARRPGSRAAHRGAGRWLPRAAAEHPQRPPHARDQGAQRGLDQPERAGAEDLGLGGHPLRPHADRHGLRHELRAHARAPLAPRLPLAIALMIGRQRRAVPDLQAPALDLALPSSEWFRRGGRHAHLGISRVGPPYRRPTGRKSRRRMPGRKMLSRGYTTFVALLCTAAVAFAIHANGEAAKAGRVAERAQTWGQRYARATRGAPPADREELRQAGAAVQRARTHRDRPAEAAAREPVPGRAGTPRPRPRAPRPSPSRTRRPRRSRSPRRRRLPRRPQPRPHRPSPRRKRAESMADLSRHRGITSALLAAGAVGAGVIGGASLIVKTRGASASAAPQGAIALQAPGAPSRCRAPGGARLGDGAQDVASREAAEAARAQARRAARAQDRHRRDTGCRGRASRLRGERAEHGRPALGGQAPSLPREAEGAREAQTDEAGRSQTGAAGPADCSSGEQCVARPGARLAASAARAGAAGSARAARAGTAAASARRSHRARSRSPGRRSSGMTVDCELDRRRPGDDDVPVGAVRPGRQGLPADARRDRARRMC